MRKSDVLKRVSKGWRAASCLLLPSASSLEAQTAPQVDANGTVHLPAIEIPPSELATNEAKQNFVALVRGVQNCDAKVPQGDIKDVRNSYDFLLVPAVRKLRAVFPVRIEPSRVGVCKRILSSRPQESHQGTSSAH